MAEKVVFKRLQWHLEKLEKNLEKNELKRRIEVLEEENQRLEEENKRLKYLIPFPLENLVEDAGLRHIGILIFKFLDLKSFANCRLVSKGCKDLIDEDKTWWQRILKSEKIWERFFRPCFNFSGRFDFSFDRAKYNALFQCVNSIIENETYINISILGRFFLDFYLYKQEVKEQELIQFAFPAAKRNGIESNWKARMSEVSELLDKANRAPGFWFSSSANMNTVNININVYTGRMCTKDGILIYTFHDCSKRNK